MLNPATKENLRRKSQWVDHVQMHDGAPLFSLLEINPTELCTRRCSFCPRSDPAAYPNQNLNMPVSLALKMGDELRALNYEGGVSFCGYGEPLLHPKLTELVSAFDGLRCEIVTSGDGLTVEKIRALVDVGMSHFVVSMYDGPHQIADFRKRFAAVGFEGYTLRDRWHTEADDFGLKLTNRAGSVNVGNQDQINTGSPCGYPSYEMLIDWQGDVLLCPQDWKKMTKFGNVSHQSLVEVWTSKIMHKRRLHLMRNREGLSPCAGCNVAGDLHGHNHIAAWKAK